MANTATGNAFLIGGTLLLALASIVVLSQSTNAEFVAVGRDGHYQISEDGTSWSGTLNVGINVDLDDIAHDGHQWIAVGKAGTILSSMDTETWEVVPGGITTDLTGIAYDGTSWRIVGDNGLAMRSDNGADWIAQTTPTTQKLHSVAGNGVLWVAVGEAGTIITNDGSPNWTPATSPTAKPLYGVGTNGGTWVATGEEMTPVGSGFNYWRMFTSNDGANWTPRATNTGSHPQDVVFGSGRWHTGGGLPVTSLNNGATWTYTGLGSNTIAVAYGKGTWVLVSTSGSHKYSPNGGASWTTLASSDLNVWIREVAAARLTCSPATTTVTAGDSFTFTGNGGWGPYTWTAPGADIPGATAGLTRTVQYSLPGDYVVSLGDPSTPDQDTSCQVHVNPLPFACNPAAQSVTLGTLAQVSLTGGTPPFAWVAPGITGSVPTGTTATLQYDQAGIKSVTITDASEDVQEATCTITVYVPLSCDPSPVDILMGTTGVFTATGGTPPYAWSADGASPASASGTSFSASFATPGPFVITVADSGPPAQSATCNLMSVNLPPEPKFSFLPTFGRVGEPITFAAASTDPNPGDQVRSRWSFGDGSSSQDPSPFHVFGRAGAFHVCLVAIDTAGLESPPFCQMVTVQAAADAQEQMESTPPEEAAPGPAAPKAAKRLEVNAGSDQVVTPGSMVQLHGIAKNATSTWWYVKHGPNVTLVNRSALDATFEAPRCSCQVYLVLLATRGTETASDAVNIFIQEPSPNLRYGINGPSTGERGGTITLTARQLDGLDSRQVTYEWIQLHGAPVQLDFAQSALLEIALPDLPGTRYTFAVTVTDGTQSTMITHEVTVAAGQDLGSAPQATRTTDKIVAARSAGNQDSTDWRVSSIAIGAAVALLLFGYVAIGRRKKP